MLFHSWPFLLLVLSTFTLYYTPFLRKRQVFILLASSMFFYAYRQPELLALLLFSALTNGVISYLLSLEKNYKKRLIAIIGVVINLSVLFFFKYAGLFHATFTPGEWADFLLDIPLPVGISFYTFQGISLVIDVYKQNKQTIKQSSFGTHMQHSVLFVGFFPQLVAGPIVKAKDFLPQIQEKQFSDIAFTLLFKKIILGYFLKMVIADNLKDFTFWMEFPYFKGHSSLDLWVMLFGFSFQIFADFAGYSLIAIGIAGLFGYSLRDNFLFPYTALSIRDFWKRWHISLSSFLHQYLYIPLGGNRKGRLRTYMNLFLTMLLGGIWHGASWNFMIWGAFHGLLLVTEKAAAKTTFHSHNRWAKFAKALFIFICVSIGWLLFKLPHLDQALYYLQQLFTQWNKPSNMVIVLNILIYSTPIIGYHWYHHIGKNLIWFCKLKFLWFAIMLFLLFTNSGSAEKFIYFQF